jgi:hypothetical protein
MNAQSHSENEGVRVPSLRHLLKSAFDATGSDGNSYRAEDWRKVFEVLVLLAKRGPSNDDISTGGRLKRSAVSPSMRTGKRAFCCFHENKFLFFT